MKIDLLKLVDQGGCSAKLPAKELEKALSELPKISHPNLLVDIETHDDGGVYKINDEYALIQTTDFFPPVCSDPYDFGQVAAANALSDIYAMGGQVLTAMNLVLFPENQALEILKEILGGGQDKVTESGGVLMGGHTITGDIPIYGLAVTGWVHPERIITNSTAKPGDVLILSKPIGTGIIVSAWKNGLVTPEIYGNAIDSMKQLNIHGATIMQKYDVKCATDITGFGLAGHALKMAKSSGFSLHLNTNDLPVFDQVIPLIDMGVIPGAAFRNKEFAGDECDFDANVDYNHKILLFDAQTSGGLLMCVEKDKAADVIADLRQGGYLESAIVGRVSTPDKKPLMVH
ncbi:MAG: selenide, water dikinase SelD [Bacteroidales bacterium]|nr:selenide, water dikinase SelD [Bacteroidales bacterium]